MLTWLLFHLVGFVLLGAGTVLGSVVSAAGRRTTSVAAHVAYAGLLRRVPALSGAGGLVLVVTGIFLARTMGISLGEPWISIGFTLWIVAVIVAATVSRPFGRGVGQAVDEAVAAGQAESEALRALYASPRAKIGARVPEIVLVLALLDMVYKPG